MKKYEKINYGKYLYICVCKRENILTDPVAIASYRWEK